MSRFWGLLRREILLYQPLGGGNLVPLAFFVIVIMLIPFGIGPEPKILARIAGGTVWVAALLAILLTLDRLYQSDRDDGGLDQLMLTGLSWEMLVLGKCLAHWVSFTLPLILVSPLMGLLLQLPEEGYLALILSLLVGSPALTFLGSIGASLVISVRQGGLLLALLILPLYVPILIFGASCVEAAVLSRSIQDPLLLLFALSLMSGFVGVLASAMALRLEQS
ncbi:MAG: heme exporter protein CcmB [Alphaproteobacteria bacterium]|jgi:heme exporter protein B|nr:heme exporter protein CcmB [Alphaproteobacteria bacterium]